MVQINFGSKEISCKIVYYGPGLSGKTTNLEKVFEKAPENAKGKMTSIATEGDRTLFFDFLPLNLGNVAGMKTKFQLYTVPGQVYYNATRKLVLQGVDGVIFVADSQTDKMDENIESLKNLEENLKSYGLNMEVIPFVIQFNKRDLPDVIAIEEMNKTLNPRGLPHFESVATTGQGVLKTLKALSEIMLETLNKKYSLAKQAANANKKRSSSSEQVVTISTAKNSSSQNSTGKNATAAQTSSDGTRHNNAKSTPVAKEASRRNSAEKSRVMHGYDFDPSETTQESKEETEPERPSVADIAKKHPSKPPAPHSTYTRETVQPVSSVSPHGARRFSSSVPPDKRLKLSQTSENGVKKIVKRINKPTVSKKHPIWLYIVAGVLGIAAIAFIVLLIFSNL